MFGWRNRKEHDRPRSGRGEVSRRRLLTTAVVGAVAAVPVVKATEAVVGFVQEGWFAKPHERLQNHQLADFTALFDAKAQFEAKYGQYLPYYDEAYDYTATYDYSIYKFLDYIASGWYDQQFPLIERDEFPFSVFRDGWADTNPFNSPDAGDRRDALKEQAFKDALAKLAKMKITLADGTDVGYLTASESLNGDPRYLQYIFQLVRLMPIQFLFGVNNITINPGGGGGSYDTNGGIVYIGQDNIFNAFAHIGEFDTATVDALRSSAPVAGTHEFDHETAIFFGGEWDDNVPHPSNFQQIGKKYVRRADFLNYLEVKVRGQQAVADAYFGMDWEQAQTFNNGHPMILGGDGESFINWQHYDYDTVTIESIKHWEDALSQRFGVQFPPLTDDRASDVSWRFNRYVHAVGHFLVNNPGQRDAILQDGDMSFAIHRFFAELQHYFVGPVQRQGDGLAGQAKANRPVDENSVLTQENLNIQAARALAFYYLPEDVLSTGDPIKIAHAMRTFFGLLD